MELAPQPPTPDAAPAERGAGYRVVLPQFEGPLDLLLHLIQKHELDIFDIPVAFITERYLEYIELMHALDLDIAAEYLLMAATLAHIKSRMLLPSSPADDSDPDNPLAGEEGEDPREALVRRLLEYQKFKAAAEELASRGVAGRDVFARGGEIAVDAPDIAPLASLPVFAMLDAFEKLLKRRKIDISHEVTTERVSIAERIQEVVEKLRVIRTARFEDLFDDAHTRMDLVVTFLALLEMTRLRMTRLYQTDPFESLHVTLVLIDVTAPSVQDDYR